MDKKNSDKTNPNLPKPPLPATAPKHLVVLSQVAPTAGRIYKLHKDRIVIGHVVSADVQVQGEGVAPIHSVIEVQTTASGGAIAVIYDLASTTGVFINGTKHITATLKTGDEIMIGRFRLKFAIEDSSKIQIGDRVRETSDGRKLIIPDSEDLRPLLLEESRNVEEIFDYRPASKTALEAVMSWSDTILDIQHHVDSPAVTIGTDRSNDFGIPPVLSGGNHQIATLNGDHYVLNLDRSMKGIIQRQGQIQTLDQIRAASGGSNSVRLDPNEYAKITVGDIDF